MIPLPIPTRTYEEKKPERDELTLGLYGDKTNVPDLLYRAWVGLPIYAPGPRHRRTSPKPRRNAGS